MLRKYTKKISILLITLFCVSFAFADFSFAAYNKELSKSQRDSLCQQLKSQQLKSTQGASSLGGGIIPDNVLTSIYTSIKEINDGLALILTVGHSLTCHAVHAGQNSITLLGVEIFSYPDISVWLCGAVIYMIGFMMLMSITFFVVDIAFKLGFAVIMLPIGIALWPFPVTTDKIKQLISIILKSAAIFAFLAITVSYSLNLLASALAMEASDEASTVSVVAYRGLAKQQGLNWDELNGMAKLFFLVENNATDMIANNFTIISTYFLVIVFALVYGMKLIGSTIEDYVDKFFPDKAFGSGSSSSPIHGKMTQALDFAKKHTVDKAGSWAYDVAKTQTGRAVQGAGKLLTGQYNQQIKGAYRQAKHYRHNPGDLSKNIASSVHNTAGNIAKGASAVLTGTVGRLIMGKSASQEIQNKISQKIDSGIDKLNNKAGSVAQHLNDVQHGRDAERAERQKVRKEKFDNSAVGQFVNKTASSVKAAANTVQSAYEKRIASLHASRQAIDTQVNKKKGLAKIPAKVGGFVRKIPSYVAEGAIKVAYVPNQLKAAKNVVKGTAHLTGRVLEQTGDQMQRNKKSNEQIRAENEQKRIEEEKREKEARKKGEW